MIYKELSLSDFMQEFRDFDRDYYTYEGYEALFNYYNEFDIDEDGFELDVIAICCEWSEYDEEELLKTYSYLLYDDEEEKTEDKVDELFNILERKTTVTKLSNGSFLVQDF